MRQSSQQDRVFINDFEHSAYEKWGVVVSPTTISELMTPAPNKELVTNESRLEHGKRVITRNPKKAAREVILNIQMVASSEADFLTKYDSFCEELAKGRLEIKIADLPNKIYRMDYKSCTQYSEFMMGIAKLALRLEEPDPTDRGIYSIHVN